MSYHSRPEFTAPQGQRCECLVRGRLSHYYQWQRVDHQCPKRANQMRHRDLAVCHVHARAKKIEEFRK